MYISYKPEWFEEPNVLMLGMKIFPALPLILENLLILEHVQNI